MPTVQRPDGPEGAQVFTTFRVAPVVVQPPQVDQVPALQVRVRVCSYSQVYVPVWPTGQVPEVDGHCDSLEGPEHVVVVQSPLSTNTPPVPSHTQALATGEPVGLGHDQVRRSPVFQLLPVPVMPAGHAALYGNSRHSGAGATHVADGAQVLTTFRVAPVLVQPPQAVHVPALQVRERVCSYSQV